MAATGVKAKASGRGSDIFSAIGAATGLGNAMRFPGLCARYGVGFLAVYALCLVVVCLPILAAELSLGAKFRTPFSGCVKRLAPKFGLLARAAVVNAAFTGLYYGGVMIGTGSSALQAVGADSSFSQGVVISAVVWTAAYLLLRGGSSRLSRSGRLSLVCFMLAMVPVAVAGLGKFSFNLVVSAFFSGAVWTDALCQAMLSLSLAAGVMPAFAANMAEGGDPTSGALKIVSVNLAVCALGCIAVMPYGAVGGNGDGLSASGELFPRIFAEVYGDVVSGRICRFAAFAALTVVAVQSACSLMFPLVQEKAVVLPWICAAGFALSPLLAKWPALVGACDFIACTVAAPIIAAFECIMFAVTRRRFMRRGAAAFCIRFICPVCCALAAAASLSGARILPVGKWLLLIAVCIIASAAAIKILRALTAGAMSGKMELWKRLKACATHLRGEVSRHIRSLRAKRRSNS